MECFDDTGFVLTSVSHGPSAIAEIFANLNLTVQKRWYIA